MSDSSRLAFQIRHYRALAQIALDCAQRMPEHRLPYLELAKQWSELAEQLESIDPGNRNADPIRREPMDMVSSRGH